MAKKNLKYFPRLRLQGMLWSFLRYELSSFFALVYNLVKCQSIPLLALIWIDKGESHFR